MPPQSRGTVRRTSPNRHGLCRSRAATRLSRAGRAGFARPHDPDHRALQHDGLVEAGADELHVRVEQRVHRADEFRRLPAVGLAQRLEDGEGMAGERVEALVGGELAGVEAAELGAEGIVVAGGLEQAEPAQFLHQEEQAELGDQPVHEADFALLLVGAGADGPQLLVEHMEGAGQVAVAHGFAECETLGELLQRREQLHVGERHGGAVAKVERELFGLVGERAEVGADAADEFGERVVGDLLAGGAELAQRLGFDAVGPILFVGQRTEELDGAEFFQSLEERAPLVRFAGGDQQPDAVPAERLEFAGKFTERFGDGGGLAGAVVAEEVAVAEPDELGAAEEGQRLERLAQPGEPLEGLIHVAGAGLDELVVHGVGASAPLVPKLAGTLLDGEFVVAADEHERRGAGGGRGHQACSPD